MAMKRCCIWEHQKCCWSRCWSRMDHKKVLLEITCSRAKTAPGDDDDVDVAAESCLSSSLFGPLSGPLGLLPGLSPGAPKCPAHMVPSGLKEGPPEGPWPSVGPTAATSTSKSTSSSLSSSSRSSSSSSSTSSSSFVVVVVRRRRRRRRRGRNLEPSRPASGFKPRASRIGVRCFLALGGAVVVEWGSTPWCFTYVYVE